MPSTKSLSPAARPGVACSREARESAARIPAAGTPETRTSPSRLSARQTGKSPTRPLRSPRHRYADGESRKTRLECTALGLSRNGSRYGRLVDHADQVGKRLTFPYFHPEPRELPNVTRTEATEYAHRRLDKTSDRFIPTWVSNDRAHLASLRHQRAASDRGSPRGRSGKTKANWATTRIRQARPRCCGSERDFRGSARRWVPARVRAGRERPWWSVRRAAQLGCESPRRYGER